MNTFSGSECIGLGWRTFKKRPWFFIGAILLAGIAFGVASSVIGEIGKIGVALGLLAFLANIALQNLYGMGFTNFFLNATKSVSEVQLKDFWHPRSFWSFLGAMVLVGLCGLGAAIVAAICGGVAALIAYFISSGAAAVTFFVAFGICAIVALTTVGLMFLFVRYVVIERDMGPTDAMRESIRMTRGNRWKLLWFLILCLLVNLLGLICLVVGLIVSIPVSALAMTHAYRALSASAPAQAA